jgi:hypothetical protein
VFVLKEIVTQKLTECKEIMEKKLFVWRVLTLKLRQNIGYTVTFRSSSKQILLLKLNTVPIGFSSYPSQFSIHNYHAVSSLMLINFTFDVVYSLVPWLFDEPPSTTCHAVCARMNFQ